MIYLIDSADPEEAASCLGAAQIPLLGLVTRGPNDGRIEGMFAIHSLASLSITDQPKRVESSTSSETNGRIHVKLYWKRPYTFGRTNGFTGVPPCQSIEKCELNKEETVLTRTSFESVQVSSVCQYRHKHLLLSKGLRLAFPG